MAAQFVIDQLDLEPDLLRLKQEHGGAEPWEILTEIRTGIYNEMVADPQVLRDNRWPHTIALLRQAKDAGCGTGLATSSSHDMTFDVLRALDLERSLDVVLTREDVEKPKPDPEAYLLGAQRLHVSPAECLVVEDSPNGVRAGLAAGMHVIAFATPFTTKVLHESRVIGHDRILHDPDDLLTMAGRVMEEEKQKAAGG